MSTMPQPTPDDLILKLGLALLGPILSVCFGFAGGLVSDRLRFPISEIDAELRRLEDLGDDMIGLVASIRMSGEAATKISGITGALQKRHRLGQNLTRLLRHKSDWSLIEVGLGGLSSVLGKLEAVVLAPAPAPRFLGRAQGPVLPDGFDEEVQTAISDLRHGVTKALAKDFAWTVLRKRKIPG
ncbi:MAG: hypothetical protein KF842_06685 [Caulobacter sp.]|nr:hypothetical protein [Caulobacter sp.]